MSGGHFLHAYQLVDMDDSGTASLLEYMRDALKVTSALMKDVEWVESGDSIFDEAMADEWYRKVHNLCVRLSGEGEER